MAAVTVAVPDIGDFTDVPVVEILVKAGDTVAVEDPLVTLESDKATMDVPAPVAGKVGDVLVKLGDTVSEGSAVVTIEAAEGEPEVAPDEEREHGAPPTPSPPVAEPAAAAPSAAAPAAAAPAAAAPPAAAPSAGGPIYASPSVRRRARELGLDLTGIAGSGRGGRILLEDLDRGARPGPAAPAAAPGVGGAGERVPLTRIQQISRDNLTRNWQTIPHVTHHEDADITDLEAFRKQLNAEQSEVKVTMVALLMCATAATLRAFPRFASSLDGDELIIKSDLHLGFAADTPNGLVVPVIRDVDRKGLLQIAGELTDLSGKARAGKLSPKEMSGAVFTISSLGGIGGTAFTPIVNLPQVAILGVVRSAMKPVWNGSEFEPRLILPLSLSYDHRVIDGAAAARFCAHLAGVLGDLRRVLL
ncbi:MAG TPA: 2-oxo acid dehydrogenase subunit E2 [Solirubrobacteraceae bacterium]